jgi:hypothetical protein
MGSDAPWVLHGNTLFSVGGPRVARRLSLSGLRLRIGGAPRLAVDTGAHRIWIVVTNAATTRIVELDERTLRELRGVTWPQLVQSAVAYRGHLYLENDFGVADLAPGAAQPHVIAGLSGAVGPIAVDPTRHRLIAIDLGYPTDVWAYRPGHLPVEASVPIDIRNGSITVVRGMIWLAGYAGAGHAVLMRLDPSTLLPVQRADARLFDPGAVIVGSGTQVLWVQPGNNSNLLACVSARSGRIEQQWRPPGVTAATSSAHGALVATPSGVLGLIMAGCTG